MPLENTDPLQFEKPIQKPKNNFWQVLKKVVLFVIPMVLKNQKGIKGTPNEEKVDKAAEILEDL